LYLVEHPTPATPRDGRAHLPRILRTACRRIASRYSEVNPPLPPETASGRSEQDPMGQTVGAIGTMQNESSPTVGAWAGATSAQATPMDTAHTIARVAKRAARRMGFTSWAYHYR